MLNSPLRSSTSYAASTSLRLGHRIRPFRFGLTSRKLSRQGTPIRLNGMPLKVLHHLLERPGELASRAELQHLLWNGTAYGNFEQGLNSVVNLLRSALNDCADQPRYIETVPGQGYRFAAPIRSVSAEAQSSNLVVRQE